MSALPKNLSLADLRRALDLYLGLAWPKGREGPVLPQGRTLARVLDGFEQESPARWALRVGNHRYPHMKLVVEKALHCERLFLSVDTHDQARLAAACTDTLVWNALQFENGKLARDIEHAWHGEGLPTRQSLSEFVEHLAPAADCAPRILVVDDEEDAANLYAMQIASQGFKVEVAYSGEAALKLMRQKAPALVLLDYMMPNLSGREVAEAMRADPRLAKIPVIIATYAQTGNVDFSAADEVIAKPFSIKQISRQINKLLTLKV